MLPWPWSLGPSAYGGSDGQQALLERHGVTAPLFLMNWSMREHGWMTGGFSFGALWSVSVEEQFYILWPLTLLVVPKRFRRVMMISGIVLSAAYRTQLVLQDPPYYKYYLNTGMVADALLAGGLLAHILKEHGGRMPRPPLVVILGVAGAVAYHIWTGAPGDRGPVAEAIRLIVLPWGAVGLLWCVLEPGPIARFFQWKPFLWLGQVSYGLYIWHTAIMHAVRHVLEPLKTTNGGSITPGIWHLTSSALSFVLVCLVAWASFRWFERPFLRWKEKLA
jgi:peptidoglycan/LPS O-acetylase OafA/YrhL